MMKRSIFPDLKNVMNHANSSLKNFPLRLPCRLLDNSSSKENVEDAKRDMVMAQKAEKVIRYLMLENFWSEIFALRALIVN